jgi:hypothetical protein
LTAAWLPETWPVLSFAGALAQRFPRCCHMPSELIVE